jgi:hypothetical protein
MKIAVFIFGLLLFCNPLAVGLELWMHEVRDAITYINIFGTILFGYFLHEVINARKSN